MALKDLTRKLMCVVYFVSLLDMVLATSSGNITSFLFAILYLGLLCGIAIIAGCKIGIYFCCKKRSSSVRTRSVNPNQGVVVTVIGLDTRTIITPGNVVQKQHPIEQYSHV
uniref:Uncharacterized protein LOC111135271 n=1 Tax=Crassostrea virginica TaxID=6565 RepID=A0A8B8ELW6_CRAVI|nr:uncharacterized protein LOC111135271 [Crassostrea virginica]